MFISQDIGNSNASSILQNEHLPGGGAFECCKPLREDGYRALLSSASGGLLSLPVAYALINVFGRRWSQVITFLITGILLFAQVSWKWSIITFLHYHVYWLAVSRHAILNVGNLEDKFPPDKNIPQRSQTMWICKSKPVHRNRCTVVRHVIDNWSMAGECHAGCCRFKNSRFGHAESTTVPGHQEEMWWYGNSRNRKRERTSNAAPLSTAPFRMDRADKLQFIFLTIFNIHCP